MKSNYNYFSILLLVLSIVSCKPKSENHEQHRGNNMKYDTTQVLQKYFCPMHPEIVSDKPGICPKCKMDLELMPSEEKTDTLSYLIQPSNQTIISTIKPISPSFNKGVNQIEALGFLTYNPNLANSVSARVSGRIEKLYAKYNFQKVNKGQLLMEIYSPELQTAQSEYLLMFNSASTNDKSILDALHLKLTNLGMTESSIKEIESSGKINATVSIYSPYSGHVHFLSSGSNIVSHGLVWPTNSTPGTMDNSSMGAISTTQIIKEGDYVKKDDLLFTIANESSIWALFKILPRDIPLIQKGDEVEILINGKTHNGKVDFIEKSFEAGSDFYTIRVYLDCNNHNGLIIGTIIQGRIITKNKGVQQLWIPKLAVINLGKSRYAVFEKEKIGYSAKEIRIGKMMGEWTEVLFGLSENDSIAPVASYLVDSEAFINTK